MRVNSVYRNSSTLRLTDVQSSTLQAQLVTYKVDEMHNSYHFVKGVPFNSCLFSLRTREKEVRRPVYERWETISIG